jgi:hypothetical protein
MEPTPVPTATPTRNPTVEPTPAPTTTPSRNPTRAPVAECPIAAPEVQIAHCTERSGKGYDKHQKSAICPVNSAVCAGDGDWEFAEGSSITWGNSILFAGTISCRVVGTSDTVHILVQEREKRTGYTFNVVGGNYAITAVNLKGSSEANYCTWLEGPVISTDILYTPVINNNPNNVNADLSHADICLTACFPP